MAASSDSHWVTAQDANGRTILLNLSLATRIGMQEGDPLSVYAFYPSGDQRIKTCGTAAEAVTFLMGLARKLGAIAQGM